MSIGYNNVGINIRDREKHYNRAKLYFWNNTFKLSLINPKTKAELLADVSSINTIGT